MFDAPKTILFLSVGKLFFLCFKQAQCCPSSWQLCCDSRVYHLDPTSLSLTLYLVYTVPYSLGTLLFYLIAIPEFLFINWGRGGGGHWVRRGGRMISKLGGHILFTVEFSNY